MKVLNIVVAKVWGGGEQYVYDTSKALRNQGIKVYIAVDETNEFLKKKFSEVADVVPVKLYSFMCMRAYSKLKEFILNNDIKILTCHSGRAMFLCIALKLNSNIKLISVKHNAVANKNDIYHKWQRSHVDAVICVSNLVYELQTRNLNKIQKEKFHLIYNGIDTDKYFCNITKRRGRLFKIGYAGRLKQDKGVGVLLEAFHQFRKTYPDTELYLAGSDEDGYWNALENYIDTHNLNDCVKYFGLIDNMQAFYSEIDVFVLPSIVKEAFGLVICEAMYSGLPVITTDSGAQKEIIEDGESGFIVQPGDIKSLSDCLSYVYKNDCYEIRRAAYKTVVARFTMKVCSDKLVVLYKQLVG